MNAGEMIFIAIAGGFVGGVLGSFLAMISRIR